MKKKYLRCSQQKIETKKKRIQKKNKGREWEMNQKRQSQKNQEKVVPREKRIGE